MPTGSAKGKLSRFIGWLYRPANTVEGWTTRVTAEFHGLFPGSKGGVGRVLDLPTRKPQHGYLLHDCQPDVAAMLRYGQAVSRNRVDVVEHGSGLRRLCSGELPEALRKDSYVQRMREHLEAVGVADMFHLTARAESLCVTVGVMLPGGYGSQPRPLWEGVAQHFETACALQLRAMALRDAIGRAAGGLGEEAQPEGQFLSSPWWAWLRRFPVMPESLALAGSFGWSGPTEECREVWLGIREGRWAVIDRCEAEGRRYVLAMELPPGARHPAGLTAREEAVAQLAAAGYSDKLIAHHLGRARSTVATQLAAAMRKLEVPNRVQLARTFRTTRTPSGCAALMPHGLALHHLGLREARLLSWPSGLSAPTAHHGELTPAQREVVRWALVGLGDAEIAARTQRSRHTVSNLLRQAYRRLGVSGRGELSARDEFAFVAPSAYL